MPPLPSFPYDALWEPVRALGWTTRGQTDEVIDALRPAVEDYAKAYAALLLARVAELQVERDRMKDALEWVRGHISRYDPPGLPNHVAQRIDAALAAHKEQP